MKKRKAREWWVVLTDQKHSRSRGHFLTPPEIQKGYICEKGRPGREPTGEIVLVREVIHD